MKLILTHEVSGLGAAGRHRRRQGRLRPQLPAPAQVRDPPPRVARRRCRSAAPAIHDQLERLLGGRRRIEAALAATPLRAKARLEMHGLGRRVELRPRRRIIGVLLGELLAPRGDLPPLDLAQGCVQPAPRPALGRFVDRRCGTPRPSAPVTASLRRPRRPSPRDTPRQRVVQQVSAAGQVVGQRQSARRLQPEHVLRQKIETDRSRTAPIGSGSTDGLAQMCASNRRRTASETSTPSKPSKRSRRPAAGHDLDAVENCRARLGQCRKQFPLSLHRLGYRRPLQFPRDKTALGAPCRVPQRLHRARNRAPRQTPFQLR